MTVSGSAAWRPGHDRPCYRCRHWRGEGRSHGRCEEWGMPVHYEADGRYAGIYTEAGASCERWEEAGMTWELEVGPDGQN